MFGIFAIFVGSYNGFAVQARLVREFYNYRSARIQAGIMQPLEAKAKLVESLQKIQKPHFGCMTYIIWLMPSFLRPLCCCRAEVKNFKKMQVAMDRLHAEFDISRMIIEARADALYRKANMKPHQIEAASFSRMFVIGDEDIEPNAEGLEELPESRLPSMNLLSACEAPSYDPSEDPVDRQLLKDISGVRLDDALGRLEDTEFPGDFVSVDTSKTGLNANRISPTPIEPGSKR